MFDTDEHLHAALRLGVSGFLLKVSPPEQLIDAVRVAAAGDALIDPAVTTRVIASFAARPEPAPAPELDTLTGREREVLELLVRGLSNAEIGERLLVGEATVRTHVGRIFQKLGLRDRVQAVVYGYEAGIVRRADDTRTRGAHPLAAVLARRPPGDRRRRSGGRRGIRAGRLRPGARAPARPGRRGCARRRGAPAAAPAVPGRHPDRADRAVGRVPRRGDRLRHPLAAWQFYSNLILVHTVGSQSAGPRRRAAGVLAVLAAYALLQTLPGQDVAESLIGAIFMGVAYGSGILLRRQTRRTVQMAQRAAVAATEERTRIARELHDVISHNVSLMTLQTGGVRMLLGTDRERERDLLRAVERAGRDTVEELRMLLGVLRDGRPPAGSTASTSWPGRCGRRGSTCGSSRPVRRARCRRRSAWPSTGWCRRP